jgi:hypothetical protein
MADINVQMPTENEDFDATATTTAQPAVTDVSAPTPAAETSVPSATYEETPAAAPAPQAAVVTGDTQPAKARKSLPVWPLLVGLLTLVVLGLAYYSMGLASDKKDLQSKLDAANANPQLLVQKQTDKLIADVAKLMTLPTDEVPTVANVSDAAKAKEQSAFFKDAQNGDRVLMYVKAGQAILYRPSTNKIILVAPLTFNNSTAATSSSSTTTTPTTKR